MHGKLTHALFCDYYDFNSDLIEDCSDGSDETDKLCREVCRSPSLWISEDGCLDNPSTSFLGKYDEMSAIDADGKLEVKWVCISRNPET